MDEPYFKLHLRVDDYLAGNLSAGDLAIFEERMLWDQSLADEVELADSIRRSLKSYGEAAAAEHRAVDNPDRRFNWSASPRYAIAATVFLAVSLGFNLLQGLNNRPDQGISGFDPATPQVISLIATRATGATPIIVNPESWIVLTTNPVRDFNVYRLSLRKSGQNSTTIRTEDGLLSTGSEPLAIGLPGSALPSGSYVLMIEAKDASADSSYQTVSEVRFNIASNP